MVRDPGRAAGLPADSVAVTDARDASGLAEAIHGVDAVVLCVGPVSGQSTTIQHDSAAAVIGAMEETGVRRLIAVSASGWVVDGDDPLTRYLAKPILARVLRDANADFAAMEAVVRASGVDWTLVRPPRLTDAAARALPLPARRQRAMGVLDQPDRPRPGGARPAAGRVEPSADRLGRAIAAASSPTG